MNQSKVNTFVQGKTRILDTFSVKGLKTWTGREGVGAQTTLYKDGKKVGLCTDEGNGGEVDFRGHTIEAEKMVREFVKSLPEYRFSDYWKEQYGDEWDGQAKSDLESWTVAVFADVMLNLAEEEKQLKKLCKTKTVVRAEGFQNFGIFDVKWPTDTYGQLVLGSQLTKQLHPRVITEIVNKRFD
jgi:hypothetical protein